MIMCGFDGEKMQLQAHKNLNSMNFVQDDKMNPELWKRGTLMKKTQFKQLVLLFFLIVGIGMRGQDTIYVDVNASGLNDGSSWVNAYDSLHTALNNSISGDQIWIAQGIYKPTNTGDRNISFDLQAGKVLSIFGGFSGGEIALNQRNVRINPVILSGDIGIPANNSDNSFHVLRVASNANIKLIDGVQIRDGNADGSGADGIGAGLYETAGGANSRIEFRNCRFENNSTSLGGGAIYSGGGSSKYFIVNTVFYNNNSVASSDGGAIWHNHPDSLVISHSKFFSNSSTNNGGAVFTNTTNPLIVLNSLFSGNNANNDGGAIFHTGITVEMNHNTFSQNTATIGRGGAIFYDNTNAGNNISNSIFWGNTDGVHSNTQGNSDIFSNTGALNLTTTIVEGSTPASGTGVALVGNPSFVDSAGIDGVVGTPDDDLRLMMGSAAHNNGGSGAQDIGDIDRDGNRLELIELDINLGPRVKGGLLDIGAIEGIVDPMVVSIARDDSIPGGLRFAIVAANLNIGPDTIRVSPDILNQRIILNKDLPSIMDNGLVIDGSGLGSLDSLPHLQLDGRNITQTMLDIRSNNNEIRFLNFINSANYAIQLMAGASNNHIWGNYFGINLNGTDTTGNPQNYRDIYITTNNNLIGDTLHIKRNVFSGSDRVIWIQNGQNNTIAGNVIGMSFDQSIPFGGTDGIYTSGTTAGQNIIGVRRIGAENIIGNMTQNAININGGIGGNLFVNNFLGTNIAGVSHPIQRGIFIANNPNNQIGDTLNLSRNFIASHFNAGIAIFGVNGNNNDIVNNYIGTNPLGTAALGATGYGINIYNNAHDNQVGNEKVNGRNLISGNSTGIFISSADSNNVHGNLIGTNFDITATIPNNIGIMYQASSEGSIGTPSPGSDNIIGGSAQVGIELDNSNSIHIVGNFIGTDPTETFDMPNLVGVRYNNGASNAYLAFNTIKSNGTGLDFIGATTDSIQFLENSIYKNTVFGTFDPNSQQSLLPPKILAIFPDSVIFGKSAPNALVNFYADTTDQAQFWIDSVRADAAGDWSRKIDLTLAPNITATQDSASNTSFFTLPYPAVVQDPLNVTSNLDDGTIGTFRFAVAYANSLPNKDTITFAISGQSIILDTTLVVDQEIYIDASGLNITLEAQSGFLPGEFLFEFQTGAENSYLKGLAFNGANFADIGIDLEADSLFLDSITVYNFNQYGAVAVSSYDTIANSHFYNNALVGIGTGTDPGTSVYLENNFVGTDAAGTTDAGGLQKIGILAHRNVHIHNNVVSGNDSIGILLGRDNLLTGNLVGLNFAGTAAIANTEHGISISNGNNNIIGDGTIPGRNIISGNGQQGIRIDLTDSNKVIGNIIGMDITGTTAIGNNRGIEVYGYYNVIGDTLPDHGNLISGNTLDGIYLNGGNTKYTKVQSNIVGTQIDTVSPGGSQLNGIYVHNNSKSNLIGGLNDKAANIIGHNASYGIIIQNIASDSNQVFNNYIGVNKSLVAIPNNTGIWLNDGNENEIGKTGDFSLANRIINNTTSVLFDGGTNNRFGANFIMDNATTLQLVNGANNNILPPQITNIDLSNIGYGNASPNALVSLYADSTDQGQFYLDTVRADGAGNWTYDLTGLLNLATYITATQDSMNNSSEFSVPFLSQPVDPLVVIHNTADSIAGDIRFAIAYASNNPGPDSITFAISNDTILVDRPLNIETVNGSNTIIDGSGQNVTLKVAPGFPSGDRALLGVSSAFTIIKDLELDGSGLARHGIFFDNPGQGDDGKAENLYVHHFENGIIGDANRDSVVNSVISQNSNAGVSLGLYGVVIGNKIGTDLTGNTPLGGQKFGVGLSTSNILGGTSISERNIITGNDSIGVYINGQYNSVINNYIGINPAGNSALGNQEAAGGGYGVIVVAANNVIDQNTISAHTYDGIVIESADSTEVKSNIIGLNGNGNSAFGNDRGIYISSSNNVIIGDSTLAKGNVIVATSKGIEISSSNDTKIYGNYFGTDTAGTTALLGTEAIDISGDYTKVGNGSVGARNIINASLNGIFLRSNASILGNYIGTDRTGTVSMGTNTGIRVGYDNAIPTFIGDGTVTGINIISGNVTGINVSTGSAGQYLDNINILGNYFGLDPAGNVAAANNTSITIDAGARGVRIGNGTTQGQNIIAGGNFGIMTRNQNLVGNPLTGGNIINNNMIGFDSSGNPGPITNYGIFVGVDAKKDSIIANAVSNSNFGIRIDDASADSIILDHNSIYSNGTAPIYIEPGAQGNIQTPVIFNIASDSTVSGFSSPNARVQLFADNANEAQFYLAETTADGLGNWSIPNVNLTLATNITAMQDSLGRSSALTLPKLAQPIDPLVVSTLIDDSIPGALRFAIHTANLNVGPDTIRFDPAISNSTITINSALPAITDDYTVIDGDIDGDSIPSIRIVPSVTGFSGITINSAYNEIKNINIAGFNSGASEAAIKIENVTAFENVLTGNYIGTNLVATDTVASQNYNGVSIGISSKKNYIGLANGSKAANTIAGNFAALDIKGDSNIVVNNYIGTNSLGTVALYNSRGIVLNNTAAENLVGNGSVSGENIISGNTVLGMYIVHGGTRKNKIIGNKIGTNKLGTAILANGTGIFVQGGDSTLIGGVNPGEGNLISGNTTGIDISGTFTNDNIVLGNKIGTDITGTLALANTEGIRIFSGSFNNSIGNGTLPGANYISGNSTSGIIISGAGSKNNIINYNFIGTQIDGSSPLGHNNSGVVVQSNATLNFLYNNIIAHNGNSSGRHGINILGATVDSIRFVNNRIYNNFDKGINISAGSQGNIMPPRIFNILPDSTVQGFSAPNAGIELYADNGSQGQTLVASTTADATGVWSIPNADLTLGTNLTALQDSLSRSSEFSAPILSQPINQVHVTSALDDSIPGTLRWAIGYANSNATTDSITFSNGMIGSTINLNSLLPTITDNGVLILADINSDLTPDVTIDGTLITSIGSGINISADSVTVSGLRIANFTLTSSRGIEVNSKNANIEFNWLGTADGTTAAGNYQGLALLAGSDNAVISNNTIVGNAFEGIVVNNSDSVAILGNRIGVDITANSALGNQNGLYITNSRFTQVGDSVLAHRNIISGNTGFGIRVALSDTVKIMNNYIGLGADGNTALGNGTNGIVLGTGARYTEIGNGNPNNRNVISSNQTGIRVDSESGSSEYNIIRGNYIGTDVTGAIARGNTVNGVQLSNSSGVGSTRYNTIGGLGAGEANIISGNGNHGIQVEHDLTNGNTVIGNIIGADVTNTFGIGNTGNGINIATYAFANNVDENIIRNNGNHGVNITEDDPNVVFNYTRNNLLFKNLIFSNSVSAIEVEALAQLAVKPPVIIDVSNDTTITGQAAPFCFCSIV